MLQIIILIRNAPMYHHYRLVFMTSNQTEYNWFLLKKNPQVIFLFLIVIINNVHIHAYYLET